MGRGSSSKGAMTKAVSSPWKEHAIFDDDAGQDQFVVDQLAEEASGGGSDEGAESEDDHGGYTDDEAHLDTKAVLPVAADEDWGGRGRRYKDLKRFTEVISHSMPLRLRRATPYGTPRIPNDYRTEKVLSG